MASKTPKKCCWSLDVEAPKSAADSANTLTNSHMRAVRPESGLTRVSAKELKVGKKSARGKRVLFYCPENITSKSNIFIQETQFRIPEIIKKQKTKQTGSYRSADFRLF